MHMHMPLTALGYPFGLSHGKYNNARLVWTCTTHTKTNMSHNLVMVFKPAKLMPWHMAMYLCSHYIDDDAHATGM